MNKRSHRWVTIESLLTEPAPRARVTCLVDRDRSLVQVRVTKGSGHRTVTMGIGAWRHLVAEVEKRIEGKAP